MIPRREFARTEFFNDFLLPQDHGSMLGAVVHVEHSRQLSVVVQEDANSNATRLPFTVGSCRISNAPYNSTSSWNWSTCNVRSPPKCFTSLAEAPLLSTQRREFSLRTERPSIR